MKMFVDDEYFSKIDSLSQGFSMSPSPPVTIAIRFTYVLQDWQQHTWPQQPPGGVCNLNGKF